MRSLFELQIPSLEQELARSGARLSSRDIHRMVQQHRAMLIGDAISDALIWLGGLPQRAAGWATASTLHHVQPWRS